MAKTMQHMKAITKSYLRERVRVRRAAETIVAAHHAGFVAAHQAAVQAQQDQAVLQAQHDLIVAAHQAALQAQHDQILLQAVEARGNGGADDEWLIAHEYENEEWEDGV